MDIRTAPSRVAGIPTRISTSAIFACACAFVATVLFALFVVLRPPQDSVVFLRAETGACDVATNTTSEVRLAEIAVRDTGQGLTLKFSIQSCCGKTPVSVKFAAFSKDGSNQITKRISLPSYEKADGFSPSPMCIDQPVIAYFKTSPQRFDDFELSVETM